MQTSGKVTTTKLLQMKSAGEKITMLTAYDYPTARLLDEAGIDIILVGDSLGMVVLGYENTLPVTIEEIIYHTQAVKRGTSRALVVADMPFLSYEVEVSQAVLNAGRLIKKGGAEAVKMEGGSEISETISAIVRAGIPVMGHIGLTPQSIHQLGGYKVQGRDKGAAKKLRADAFALSAAGAFALVIECVPWPLAQQITQDIGMPTIGIGAGAYCDGQVLVLHDLLGLYDRIHPKFVRQYVNLNPLISKAIKGYISDVRESKFPSLEESYK
ncbi:MAG: 3-methyl-2-oxobutanoate hydroxymethyltransferase [bacterium]